METKELRERTLIRNIVVVLTALFFVFFIGAYFLWMKRTEPQGMKLFLSVLILSIFLAGIYRCVHPLIDFWNQEQPLNEEVGNLRRIIFYAILWLIIMDAGLFLLCKWKFPELSFYDGLDRLWKSISLDPIHYLNIAENGYTADGPDRFLIVFFPLYPLLIKVVSLLFNNTMISALLINHILTIINCCLLYHLSSSMMTRKQAEFAVILFLLFPASFFMAFPMTEALYIFCVLLCMIMTQRDRWILAGVAAFLAALTRSTGLLLVVYMAIELIQRLIHKKIKRTLLLTLFFPLIGFSLYLLVNYLVAGNAFQFAVYQKEHWSMQISWFFNTVSYQWDYMVYYLNSGQLKYFWGFMFPGFLTVFASCLILLVGSRKIKISLMGYSYIYFIMTMGATWLLSGPRYMASLFTLPMILSARCTRCYQREITFFTVFIPALFLYIFFLLGYAVY